MTIWIAGGVALAAALGFCMAPGFKGPAAGSHAITGSRAIYDPSTESSVSGTLAQPPERGRMGLDLSVLESSGQMLDVRVAPRAYLTDRGFSLDQGDELEITGSRVMVRGAPVLIAREVTKQGRTLRVRDRDGRPLWQ